MTVHGERAGGVRAAVRPGLLLLLTSGLAMAECAALKAFRFTGALDLAPQIGAPVPYGVFHDLRWVFVYNSSWLMFAVEIAGLIAFRALARTVIIALAWPTGHASPSPGRLLARNAVFTVIAAAVLSVWVCVSVAASGTSLSWSVLGELLPVLGISLVLAAGGITADWWRGCRLS